MTPRLAEDTRKTRRTGGDGIDVDLMMKTRIRLIGIVAETETVAGLDETATRMKKIGIDPGAVAAGAEVKTKGKGEAGRAVETETRTRNLTPRI